MCANLSRCSSGPWPSGHRSGPVPRPPPDTPVADRHRAAPEFDQRDPGNRVESGSGCARKADPADGGSGHAAATQLPVSITQDGLPVLSWILRRSWAGTRARGYLRAPSERSRPGGRLSNGARRLSTLGLTLVTALRGRLRQREGPAIHQAALASTVIAAAATNQAVRLDQPPTLAGPPTVVSTAPAAIMPCTCPAIIAVLLVAVSDAPAAASAGNGVEYELNCDDAATKTR
jgi:hypothetical protein